MQSITDEQVEELLKTRPFISNDIKVQQQWSLGQFIVSKQSCNPHYGFKCYYEYMNLISTVSLESFKKLCAFNPTIAKSSFASIAEQSRGKPILTVLGEGNTVKNKYEFGNPTEKIKILDWIVDSKLVPPKYMISDLVRYRHFEHIQKIIYADSIDVHTLHICLNELCCYMHKSESGWTENVVNRDRKLFDLFFNDPRIDPSIRDNHALSLAIGHRNDYAVNKLLSDPRVLACENWTPVLHQCINNVELFKKLFEYPNVKLDRRIMQELRNVIYCPEYDWLRKHPKYIETEETVFRLKTPEQLLQRAIEEANKCYNEKLLQILQILRRRIRGEPEDLDADYDDEHEAYVYDILPWYKKELNL